MATTHSNMPLSENREKLKNHMSKYADKNYVQGWDELWNDGSFLPWDRGSPSPALADTLTNHADIIGNSQVEADGKARRKLALVPGCGRGVDVLLLSTFGYDVVGLEYAQKALDACKKFVQENEEKYPIQNEKLGKGKLHFVQGDFYAGEWVNEIGKDLGSDWDGTFDLIYDYTFFCAMQPPMRPAWALRTTQLLRHSPQANLICLEFPTKKPWKSGGPPFAVSSKAYLEHLSNPGDEVKYDDEGNVKGNPLAPSSEGGLERVGLWHPADTHGVGKNQQGEVEDNISVWRHR